MLVISQENNNFFISLAMKKTKTKTTLLPSSIFLPARVLPEGQRPYSVNLHVACLSPVFKLWHRSGAQQRAPVRVPNTSPRPPPDPQSTLCHPLVPWSLISKDGITGLTCFVASDWIQPKGCCSKKLEAAGEWGGVFTTRFLAGPRVGSSSTKGHSSHPTFLKLS